MFCDCVSSWTSSIPLGITKTRLFKTIQNFFTKNWKFSYKNPDLFHISSQNIDCGYSLEPPHQKHRLWVLVRTASSRRFNEYPTMFWAEKWIISNFLVLLVVKIFIYLNRRIFVMFWVFFLCCCCCCVCVCVWPCGYSLWTLQCFILFFVL